MRRTFPADLRWCCNSHLWCVSSNDVLAEMLRVLVWREHIQLCVSSTGYLTTTELLLRSSLLWQLANTIPHLLCDHESSLTRLDKVCSGITMLTLSTLWTGAGHVVLPSALLLLLIVLLNFNSRLQSFRRCSLFHLNLPGASVRVERPPTCLQWVWCPTSKDRKNVFCKIRVFV